MELGPVPTTEVELEGEPVVALLDTGSPVTNSGSRLPVTGVSEEAATESDPCRVEKAGGAAARAHALGSMQLWWRETTRGEADAHTYWPARTQGGGVGASSEECACKTPHWNGRAPQTRVSVCEDRNGVDMLEEQASSDQPELEKQTSKAQNRRSG